MPTKTPTTTPKKSPTKKAAKAPVAPRRRMPRTKLTSAVQIPTDFTINEVPFQPGVAPPAPADIAPVLGPLKAFTGTFIGRGFTRSFGRRIPPHPPICRPRSPTATTFWN